MIFSETKIPGVYVIDVERRGDGRGFFARTWCERELQDSGLANRVVQENVAFSHKQGCVRGMHFQVFPHEEVKIVRCTMGAIYDVAVDLRPDSPTHKRWSMRQARDRCKSSVSERIAMTSRSAAAERY